MASTIFARLRRHRLLVQFFEYLISGGVYFYSVYVIFAICYSGLHWDWLWAKIFADILGLIINYFLQRYWAFYSSKLRKVEGRVRRRYLVVVVMNIFIDYGVIAGLKSLGVTPYLGMFVSSGFFTVSNYLLYRFWVFKVPNAPGTSKTTRSRISHR